MTNCLKQLCVYVQQILHKCTVCGEALDFCKIMCQGLGWGVRSKVMHVGVMRALVLVTVYDLLSISFLGDLINC